MAGAVPPTAAPARAGQHMQVPQKPGMVPSLQFDKEEEVSFNAEADAAPEKPINPKPAEFEEGLEKEVEEVSTAAPEKPATETPAADPEVSFDLQDEPAVVNRVEKTATTPVTQIPSGPRNYDQYPEELRPVLKALNNQQFKQFAPKLKELHEKAQKAAELEAHVNDKPQFYYEHPEAYKLDPEYNQLVDTLNLVQFEQTHWEEQLIRIKRGEPWQDLMGYNQQTGEPIYKTHEAPTDGKVDFAAETAAQRVLTKLMGIGQARQSELANFQQVYEQSVQGASRELDELDKKLFPKIQEIDKLPPDEKKLMDIARDLAPRAMRSHPFVRTLGKSYVMFVRVLKLYQKVLQENEQLRGVSADARAAEPAVIPAGGGLPKAPRKPGEIDPDEEVKFNEED